MPDVVPSCPRCGYDLSGGLPSRKPEAATGICSECGLTFAWEDVLNPALLRVRGFVEHAEGFWQTFLWAWRTLFASFFARRFWRRVRLEHLPRPGKWVSYVLLTSGLLWLLARLVWLSLWIWVLGHLSAAPSAIAAGRVVYSDTQPIMEKLTCRVWSVDWYGYYTWSPRAGSAVPQQPPMIFSLWKALPPAAFGALAAVIMMPLMLLMLPQTRARLKIRPSHVARAGVFGALPVFVAVIMLSVVDLRDGIRDSLAQTPIVPVLAGMGLGSAWYDVLGWLDQHQFWLGMLAILWLLWWWTEAVRTGFRAQKWAQILVAQWTAALLAAAIIVMFHPDSLRYLMNWLI